MGSTKVGKEKRMIREHALPSGRDYRERGHVCGECSHFIDNPLSEDRYCVFHQEHVTYYKEACRYFARRDEKKKRRGKKKRS